MSRQAKQMIRSLVIACAMSILVPAYMLVAYAANARISFSDPTVTVGEEVSVTMKFASTSGDVLGNTDTMLSYDSTMLDYINETENASGGAGSIRVWSGAEGKKAVSTVLRFKALQAGTTKIEVSTWEAYDNDGSMVTMDKEGTSTVTISPLATSSTDATLKTLKISPGTLTPAFTPTVENYTTTVGLDIERLAVSAEVNNSGAKVVIEGGSGLQEGENTVVCRVTAENGETTKSYTITVNKVEGGENIGAGESETTPTDEGINVLAELKGYENTISIIDPEEGISLPEGFKKSSTISIGDTKVTGWIWAADESPQYCIFYAVNAAGEKGLYSYDLTERTVQRYFGTTISSGTVSEETYVQLAEDFNSLTEDFKIRRYILWGLIALTVVLIIVIIVLLSGRRSGGEPYYEERRPEEAKRKKPTGGASSRRLSKEERYMLGEEEEYEEPDYPEEESDSIFAKADEVLGGGSADKAPAGRGRSSRAAVPPAAAAAEDDDDFEVIDFDDDDF